MLWNGADSDVRPERGFGDVGALIFEHRNGGPHIKVHSPSRDDPQLIQTDADPVVLQLSKTADAVSAHWRPAQDQQRSELGTIEMASPDAIKAGVAVLSRAQSGAAPAHLSAPVSTTSGRLAIETDPRGPDPAVVPDGAQDRRHRLSTVPVSGSVTIVIGT